MMVCDDDVQKWNEVTTPTKVNPQHESASFPFIIDLFRFPLRGGTAGRNSSSSLHGLEMLSVLEMHLEVLNRHAGAGSVQLARAVVAPDAGKPLEFDVRRRC